uniref:Scaffolding anchor of CK1 domain-containing protein n=1 Tax=Periophthalmus magnuspinnatus TaxID=409849 RepID=A0A3B4AS02_9GOBI
MDSSLSGLSSLKDDSPPLYILPHYKEGYRLAIYALLCGGIESYEEFLRAEQINHFLSEQEIAFILENAELPVIEDEGEGKGVIPEENGVSTYFPTESDEVVPDLDLGWPEISLEETDTSISVLFNPPRQDTPSIKEVVRKQIEEARQVRWEGSCRVMSLIQGCWFDSLTMRSLFVFFSIYVLLNKL